MFPWEIFFCFFFGFSLHCHGQVCRFTPKLVLATVTETQLQLISVVTEIESFLVTETEGE